MNSPIVRLKNTTSQTLHAFVSNNPGEHFIRGRVLDVGCEDMPFKRAFEGMYDEWVGLDSRPVGQIVADPHDMQGVDDDSFDTVLLLDVLQSCARPNIVISECIRVLKPGGRLIVSVPNTYVDDGTTFWRFTGKGLELILTEAGLVLDVLMVEGRAISHEWAEEMGMLHDDVKGWLDKMDTVYPQITFAIATKVAVEKE